MAPAAPLTLPSPPKGRGEEERASRATMTEAEAPRGGMTAVGRPPPACHPRAWPLHGGRDTRRASPFPDSSPPPGERIKVRGGRSAQAESKAEGGTHPEARGGASSPPHPPLSPQGERETRTSTARGNDGSGASGSCLSPPRVAIAWRQGWRRPSPWHCAPVGRASCRAASTARGGSRGRAQRARELAPKAPVSVPP